MKIGLILSGLLLSLLVFSSSSYAQDGQALYLKSCKMCHAEDGKGSLAISKSMKVELSKLDLTDKETSNKKDDELAMVINDGAGKMKGFKDKMSAEEVAAILKHVRSLKK